MKYFVIALSWSMNFSGVSAMLYCVTGATGQLGADIIKRLTPQNKAVLPMTRQDCELSRPGDAGRFVLERKPEIVFHCAAYTNVDKAEDEPALCYAINAKATREIAEAVAFYGGKLLYISTDYVFDGRGEHLWTPSDAPRPINVYGKSKLDGELACSAAGKLFIVRASWLYGKNGGNFVKTMLNFGRSRESLDVVDDQIGAPTYTAHLAALLCDMAETDAYGIYHAANEGFCSKAEFAREIFIQAGIKCEVRPIRSEEYPTKAARPKNSRLDMSCLDEVRLCRLPHWKDGLRAYLEELRDE